MSDELNDLRRDLHADCARCAGLCCVAPAFAASADFAINKPAGQACPNLLEDFRCGIHEQLRDNGFAGCAAFDCFGAGQQVVQVTFGGRTWRDSPERARSMFAVFDVMRQLHELLWYLRESRTRIQSGQLRERIDAAEDRTTRLTETDAAELASFDATGYRHELAELLGHVSEHVRDVDGQRGPDHRNADLIGARLRSANLRYACLRGAYLIGTDLSYADLHNADLLGADFRAANIRGANLDDCLFLTQPQLDAAKGDAATTIPAWLRRPAHW